MPGELRGDWLREIHPAATVLVIDDRYDEADTAVWAANTVRWLGGPPDAVFTSEDYGDPYARLMGCTHVLVDKARSVRRSGDSGRGLAFLTTYLDLGEDWDTPEERLSGTTEILRQLANLAESKKAA